MLNYIWLGLILAAVVIGGLRGQMQGVTEGAVDGAETAVKLALGLIGVMAVWLGVMRLAERSGLVHHLGRALRPIMSRLFPDVPESHPAMGSMVMNIAANMLGLVNAATPLGLRAMRDLERLNPHPGMATNAMCTFLAINTGSVQLIPITAIAVLAAAGSSNPTAIIGTALMATICSSAAGLAAVKAFEKLRIFRVSQRPAHDPAAPAEPATEIPEAPVLVETAPLTLGKQMILGAFILFLLGVVAVMAFPEWVARPVPPDIEQQNEFGRIVQSLSVVAIPFLLTFFPLYAALKGLSVYEEFVEGAKEGFTVAVKIIPFLVAMLMAISMFRGAGGIELLTEWLRPALEAIRFPPELLPMALMRPLSGSGSLAIFSDLVTELGPDHLVVRMAGTLYGSTETTFYVIAVYFGAVAVHRTRHAIPAGLVADLAGIIASVAICYLVFR